MKELNKNAFNSEFKLRKIAIILGFYEGYEFINKQLQSIFDQTHQNFIIFVSDDNSKNSFSKKSPKSLREYGFFDHHDQNN